MKKNLKISLCLFGLLFMFAAEASADTPCDGLCYFMPTEFEYQVDNIGTYVPCMYTYNTVTHGNNHDFAPLRKLYVNGVQVAEGNSSRFALPGSRNGGWCFYTSMGPEWYAGFAAWNEGP